MKKKTQVGLFLGSPCYLAQKQTKNIPKVTPIVIPYAHSKHLPSLIETLINHEKTDHDRWHRRLHHPPDSSSIPHYPKICVGTPFAGFAPQNDSFSIPLGPAGELPS
ncbi:unnamed protein product [Ixodes pacificus]